MIIACHCDSGRQFIQKGKVSGPVFLAHRDDAHAQMLESYGWKLIDVERANPVPDNVEFNEEVVAC